MKEKDSQTKSCTCRTAQAQTHSSCHAAIACSGLILTKKLLMSPKRALSSLVSPQTPPPPPRSPRTSWLGRKTRRFSTLRVKQAEQSWSTSMAEETIRVAVTLTLRQSNKLSNSYFRSELTPTLGLVCHGVFKDRFIFRHILENFFPAKM